MGKVCIVSRMELGLIYGGHCVFVNGLVKSSLLLPVG